MRKPNFLSKPGIAIIAIWMGASLAATAYGQSLGELARQERAKKKMEAPAPSKVYTNSDIPPATLSGAPPPAAETNQGEGNKEAAKSAEAGKTAEGAKTEEKSQADLEKEYRDKFAKLREDQSLEERRLDVMQRD